MLKTIAIYFGAALAINAVVSLANAQALSVRIVPYQGKVGETYRANGKPMDAAQAFQAALRGEEVEKCQQMEAQVNKGGTGLSLKPKKTL